MNKFVFAAAAMLAAMAQLQAQELDYATFMRGVMEGNAGYRAARMEVPIARAELEHARKFNDASAAFAYGNNSDWDVAMGQSAEVEVSKTFSIGKRRSRMAVARHNMEAQEAGLQDYERNLRADATVAYLDALLARELARTGAEYAENMRALYRSDSLRYSRGDLSEVDVTQSLLEAEMAQQECLMARTAYRNALVRIDWMMGTPARGTRTISGELTRQTGLADLQQMLQESATRRQDVVQARRLAETAQSEVKLTQMERMPDIDLSVGMSHSTRVRNEEAPAPPFNGYTVGISLPLPVSNMNRGEVKAQQFRAQQAEAEAEAMWHAAQAEVIQAYHDYTVAISRADAYGTSIMEQALEVLNGKMYAYQRGETSLLEVLNAQHTYIGIRQDYATSLYECMKCWVELQRSCGSTEFGL